MNADSRTRVAVGLAKDLIANGDRLTPKLGKALLNYINTLEKEIEELKRPGPQTEIDGIPFG